MDSKKWIYAMLLLLATLPVFLAERVDAGVNFSLSADPSTIEIGQTSTVSLTLTPNGETVNGYQVRLSWPSKVSLQDHGEGPLYPSLCASRFTWWDEQASYIDVAHVLWCAGICPTTAGVVWTFEFEGEEAGTAVLGLSLVDAVCAGYSQPLGTISGCSITVEGGGGGGCHPPGCELDPKPKVGTAWTLVKELYR